MSCTNKAGLALLLPARAAGVSLWSSEDCLSGCCLRSSRDLKRYMELRFALKDTVLEL